ncbi:MAG TPA: hypothetical protein VGE07_25075 [Herpetosiphonaceae bacterium]
MYLAWFDDHPKKELAFKISEAIFAYEDRFGTRPNVVLVNETQTMDPVEGVQIVSRSYVRKHNFWVGVEEIKSA